jgi:hypothetical protein
MSGIPCSHEIFIVTVNQLEPNVLNYKFRWHIIYEQDELVSLYKDGKVMAIHALTDYSKSSDKAIDTNLKVHGNHSSIR